MSIFFIGALVIIKLNINNHYFKCRSPLILIALFSVYYVRFSLPIILELYFFFHYPRHIIPRKEFDHEFILLLAIQSLIIGSTLLIILLHISRFLSSFIVY